MKDDIAISVKNLSKKYLLYDSPKQRLKEALHPFRKKYHREFWALKDVSFELKKGESLGIIGRNGSGKSTLLQILSGILKPSSGETILNGRISALLELGTGFNPEFTGRNNIYMNGAINSYTREEMDMKYNAIADFADIGDFINQPVKTYSSGMYVRLGFATAIHIDPDILIIDEALAVGDLSFSQKCMDYMLKLFNNKTIVLVSHNIADIKRLCKKVIVLDKGKIHYMGYPEQGILEYYSLLENNKEPAGNNDAVEKDKQVDIAGPLKNLETDSSKQNYIYLRSIGCFTRNDENKWMQTNNVPFGNEFKLDIEYEINIKLNRPEFRISFNIIENNTLVCSSSSRNTLENSDNLQGNIQVSFKFPNPILYPREYYINAAICDQNSGLYYYSEIDVLRIKVLYPEQPVFEDMEVGLGITHMLREFSLNKITSTDRSFDETEVVYDPASIMDSFGRVFFYKGEVYREVSLGSMDKCNTILTKVDEWQKFGLVKTKSLNTPNGHPITLCHQKVEYRNYNLEWLPQMFKDAAIMYLKLNNALLSDGFTLKDGHPWNIFFDYTRPVFIDVGSIEYFDTLSFLSGIEEFKLYFLLPILLFQKIGVKKTYDFLRLPIPNHEYRIAFALETLGSDWDNYTDFTKPKELVQKLMDTISEINIEREPNSKWANYDQKEVPFDNQDSFQQKQRAVYDFLLTLPKGDILDIGCNNGWYSLLSQKLGYKVVSIDDDVPSISRLFNQAKKNDLPILTLYLDFKNPTPSHGLNKAYPSFEDRFSFDVVLAMSVMHHLTYSSKMTFDEIALRISNLCKKYALIEFIPKEDHHVSQWDQKGMEWYTRDNFIKCFLIYFNKFKVIKSSPEPREVFIFYKE